ncbi:hypothetical protein KCU67_g11159, partial [Aureobasidium melanogenum]
QRPLQLEYDTEWLAITRAFASELNIGGDPNTRAPPDLGEAHYAPLISASETWIKENVKNMTIPDNFEITAPVFDAAAGTHVQGAPREYTNNQTKQDREERMRMGPRPDEQRRDGGFRGGRGGGGRGGGRGRGNGRGRGGHGGRGRGRGRGGPRY